MDATLPLLSLNLVLLTRRKFATALALVSVLPRERPRLAVILVAEQFRADYLLRWPGLFGAGGFRRLAEAGAVFPDCRYRSSTFTSTGLATIATGTYPSTHGIVADSWLDETAEKRIRARSRELLATTLGDEAARFGGGSVFATAMTDDRGGLLAGQNPKQVFSMDARGMAVARTHRIGEIPWLPEFQRLQSPDQYRDARWVAEEAPGAPVLRTLRFEPGKPEEFGYLYKASPFGQQAQFDLIREIVVQERLGQSNGVDLLVASLGSTALLGLEVGAESPLMQHLVLKMDREIEATIDALNKTVGQQNYVLAFTAAHGAPIEPLPRQRVHGEAVAKLVDSELGGRAVARYLYPFLYLRPELRTRERRLAAGQAALRVPGVTGFYTADGDCSHHGEWRARLQNSFHPERSGDVLLSYGPGHVEEFEAGRGISYGSVYNYDAHVPLILFGSGFAAGRHEWPVEPVDIAPTLARVLGLPQPSSSSGRVLSEALATEPRERK